MNQEERAQLALEGLSVGDAFGERFFGEKESVLKKIQQREIPPPPWNFTDDSIMAIGILETLQKYQKIDQNFLAKKFATHYQQNPYRGYGGMAHHILQSILAGEPWRIVSSSVFDGSGSYGNGAAMRVAPLGAYFAEDLNLLKIQAIASAEVTHSHPEGKAGALAVALASAWAWNNRHQQKNHRQEMLQFVLEYLPNSETKKGIEQAYLLSFESSIQEAVSKLGNGSQVSSQDTVPFALWCAARHQNDFEEALWNTVSGLGDRDTTCAIVGGIVALSVGEEGIPKRWRESRESLSDWS